MIDRPDPIIKYARIHPWKTSMLIFFLASLISIFFGIWFWDLKWALSAGALFVAGYVCIFGTINEDRRNRS